MKATVAEVLREAAKDQHSNETFEKALGRVIRKGEGTFEDYLGLIAQVRARAKKDKTTLGDAANALAAEQ